MTKPTNSAERLARALELGQQAAARVTAGKPVQIRFDQKEGAFVDTETGIIHLPPVGNLDDETVDMIRALADHESGHVAETDLDVYKKMNEKKEKKSSEPMGPIVHSFANASEDNRIEKLASEKALGVARNLDWLRRHMLYKKDVIASIEENFDDDKAKAIALLEMEAVFKGTEHEDFVKEEATRFSELYLEFHKIVEDEMEAIASLSSTEEAVENAKKIVTKLRDYIEEELEEPTLSEGEGEGEGEGAGTGEGASTGEEEGEGEGEEGEGEGAGEKEGKKKSKHKEEKITKEYEKGRAAIGTGSSIYAGATCKTLEGNVGKYINAERTDVYEEPLIPYIEGDIEADLYKEKDLSKYFGTYGDAIEYGFERWNEDVREQRRNINVMRRRLLIDLLGRVKKFINRQEKGTLNDRELWRAGLGDKNLFRRRQKTVAINAAVSLLVDCSGSMSGSKIEIASDTAIVMAETLDLVGVPFEVLGFTQIDDGLYSSDVDEKREMGYTRICPLQHYIFKSFDKNLDRKMKSLIGAIPSIHLCQNIDGESLRWAAQRLALRKEEKRILIVVSDGYPAGYAEYNTSTDLKETCKTIENSGAISLFGIGICSQAPSDYYSDYAIIDDVSQLAKVAYGKISEFLRGCRTVKTR